MMARTKRHHSNKEDSPSKKKAKLVYETPHPSASTGSPVFQLPSSVGPHESPRNFSPVPVPKISQRLKENALKKPIKTYLSRNRTKSRSKESLASPFNSRPSSAQTSPQKSASNPQRVGSQKRTLSDKTRNPNVPLSTPNSPTDDPNISPNRARRPSAPTPPRPSAWTPNRVPADPFSKDSQDFYQFFENTHMDIDFNRPPSQLSLYDYNCDATYDSTLDFDCDKVEDSGFLFNDVQASSTPFHQRPALKHAMFAASDPNSEITDLIAAGLGYRSRCVTPSSSSSDEDKTMTKNLQQRSPWISDSLISPPKSMEWNAQPRKEAGSEGIYAQDLGRTDSDVDMVTAADAEFEPVNEEVLQDLFDTMIIIESPSSSTDNNRTSQAPTRTRSLDSAAAPDHKIKGRERGSTIKASDYPNPSSSSAAPARRTRSGTITKSDSSNLTKLPSIPLLNGARRTRSGTVVSVAPLPPFAEGSAEDALGPTLPMTSRRRSGSIIAPIVAKRARSGTIVSSLPPIEPKEATSTLSVHRKSTTLASTLPISPCSDPDDPLNIRPVIRDTVPHRRAVGSRGKLSVKADDEEDDELLLKPVRSRK
ncbi:hypothetical protein C8J56DRAFT_979496 [Mycena floridula]|nr:hypothetical protein C8J56DRAFT_979496 [Mycena floridula]